MSARINVNFEVRDQHLSRTDHEMITAGSKNYFYAVFDLDEVWTELSPKAAFIIGKKPPYIQPLDPVDGRWECRIPWEVIVRRADFYLGVFGGDSLRSDVLPVHVSPGTPVDGDSPSAPTPDWFTRMEEITRKAIDAATEVQQKAEDGEFDGKPGPAAGFGTPTATVETLDAESEATVEITASGDDTEKVFSFRFRLPRGRNGDPGYTPQKNVDYFDGKDGDPGYTPQKGLDYFTAAEIAEIVMAAAAEASGKMTETDPTVPEWAKAEEKPTYTAEEVGARPSTWMPTASDVGARPNTWTPSASDVGADPSGTAAASVSSHNTAEDAHEDIRLLVTGITSRLNALADSDDETLDQWSELVAYIKANRSLIEQITTGKVSVSDIIDNLTTNVANKPLSAAQGVALKALIDGITVPTKVSELQNDAGYIKQHQDISGKADKATTLAGYGITDGATKSDVSQLSEEINNYLPKFVGTDKVGKIAIVGTDGYITWIDMPEGSSGDVTGELDEANNILFLTGNLADGTYTVRYVNEDGTYSDPVTMEVGAIVTYTITQNLTAVTSDNSVTSVRKGESITVNFTANDGYELSSVTVTMGGTDITSSAVSDNVVTIASVTGDVVITAVAEEIKVIEPVTENITLTGGIRIGSDGTDRTQAGYCATPHIDLTNIPKPCTIHLIKALWCKDDGSTAMVRVYAKKADGTKLVADTTRTDVGGGYFTVVDNSGGTGTDVTVTVTSNDVGYIRFSGYWSKYSDSDTSFELSNTKATLTYTPLA